MTIWRGYAMRRVFAPVLEFRFSRRVSVGLDAMASDEAQIAQLQQDAGDYGHGVIRSNSLDLADWIARAQLRIWTNAGTGHRLNMRGVLRVLGAIFSVKRRSMSRSL